MQAYGAVAVEPWHVKYVPVDVPEPGPDDVVIKVTHSWISNGTEGSFVRGERIAGDTPRADTDPQPFPHISGYQKVGVVQSVGANVDHLTPGESAFATVSRVSGLFYDHGGHVSPAVTHKSQVWPLPKGLDPVAASGLVLTQVGYNVGMCGEVGPGDLAIVIGDGMVGHWTAQTLQHRGARVLMLGRHDYRLDLFSTRDGDRRLNTANGLNIQSVRDWADGANRIQYVADTVGSVPTIYELLGEMRQFGSIASAGFYGANGMIDIQRLRQRENSLFAPAGWSKSRMDSTLSLLADGALTTKHLITHRFPVEEADKAFDLILSKSDKVLGVILDW